MMAFTGVFLLSLFIAGTVGGGSFTVVMTRHGESEWTKENIFCGWYDSPLTDKGIKQAHEAGKLLSNKSYSFDYVFTSQLKRAQDTAKIIIEELGQSPELIESWRLNERHYGGLTGYNKTHMAEQYGEEQVQVWRRSYDVRPPPMLRNHTFYNAIVNNINLKLNGPNEDEFPTTESLEDTILRVIPYWNEAIARKIKLGKKVLIVAHGTVLRGLVKHIEGLNKTQIMKVNIPTASPFVYELDENLKSTGVPRQFLGDKKTIAKAMEDVASISGHKEIKEEKEEENTEKDKGAKKKNKEEENTEKDKGAKKKNKCWGFITGCFNA